MIKELKVRNYLSFKDEVVLSFEATNDKMFEDCQVVEVAKGVRLLRFGLIYGANASGKSNLFSAIGFLRRFWFHRVDSVEDGTGVIPFLFDRATPEQPSTFELVFYVGDLKYWYSLEIDKNKVLLEKLCYYKSAQPTMLFERVFMDGMSVINFNSKALKISKVIKENISAKCLSNMSFFAAFTQVNFSIPEINSVCEWMREKVMPTIKTNTDLSDYSYNKMRDDKFKSYLLNFIRMADFNISDINVKDIKVDVPSDMLDLLLKNNSIPAKERERLIEEKSITTFETTVVHTVENEDGKEVYTLPYEIQSKGTERIIGLESAIYEAINNDAFLAIDEIESSLHPSLVELVIEKFLNNKNNRSQLLITTHYDQLLNEADDLFRKDSVWFIEKGKSGSSGLYPLVEFKGLNRIKSLQKAYRLGNFGAIPNV